MNMRQFMFHLVNGDGPDDDIVSDQPKGDPLRGDPYSPEVLAIVESLHRV